MKVQIPPEGMPTHPFGMLDLNLKHLITAMYDGLEPEEAQRVRDSIAIGTLEIGMANASIVRSPDRKYAILFHYGLMMLISKSVKSIIAARDPSQVEYCNRMPTEQLTRDIVLQLWSELIEIYQKCLTPYGPMIKLTAEAEGQAAAMVYCCELFILCHEIGHFLNGDLNANVDFTEIESMIPLMVYQENKDHEKEYAADATGFRILMKSLEKTLRGDKLFAIQSLTILFNLFFLLRPEASATHPNPRDRTIRVARKFFDDQFADELERSYEDPTILESLIQTRTATASGC